MPHTVQHVPSHGLQLHACLGETDRSSRAIKKVDTELAFKPPYLLADDRLREMEPESGSAEMQFISHCQIDPQLSQLHGPAPNLTHN